MRICVSIFGRYVFFDKFIVRIYTPNRYPTRMKPHYHLDNYQDLIRQIRNTKTSDPEAIEMLTSNPIDNFLLFTVQFTEGKDNVDYKIGKPLHSLHPDTSDILDVTLSKTHRLQSYLPSIVQELKLTDHVWEHYLFAKNDIISLFIKVKCEFTAITDDIVFFNYCHAKLKDENDMIRDYIETKISRCRSSKEIVEYITKKHHAVQNLVVTLARRICPATIHDLYDISENFDRIDCLKLVVIFAEKLQRFIELKYFKYLDHSSPITFIELITAQKELQPKINFLKSKLAASEIEPNLVSIALQPILKLEQEIFKDTMTYADFRYCTSYITKATAAINSRTTPLNSDALVEWLLFMNLNVLQFFQLYSNKISSEVEQSNHVSEKLEILFWHLKTVRQMSPADTIKFKRNLPSIRKQLIGWLNEEIEYFRRKISLDTVSIPDRVTDSNPKMLCDLSVAQLSYFSALMVKAGIIKNDNQSEVFRFVANNFKTPGTEQISPVSIKTKYYNVEEPTIQVVREKIIKLLSLTKL